MKAIAYNINSQEKEWLILANYKKHEITVIANSLTLDTLHFSAGKEALIIFNQDPLSADIITGLKNLGVKYIATSSFRYFLRIQAFVGADGRWWLRCHPAQGVLY